jgi:hypothetical protein
VLFISVTLTQTRNMRIKHEQLYEFREAFKLMKEEKIRDYKVNMAIIRARRLIDSEIEALEGLKEETSGLKEFEQKRGEAAAKHARKDKSGNPVIKSTQQGPVYDIEDMEAFQEDLEKLMVEYQDVLKDRDLQMEQYFAALKSDLEIDLPTFPEKAMKNMPTEVLDVLYELIDDKATLYTEGELQQEIQKAVKAALAAEKKKSKTTAK